MTCEYVNHQGNKCDRHIYHESQYCLYHLREADRLSWRSSPGEFHENLLSLIKSKDGNWVGFDFPQNYQFNDIDFDFPVNMSWSTSDGLTFKKVVFREPFFCEHSQLSGAFSLDDVAVKSTASFNQSIFMKAVEIQNSEFNGATAFYQCEFKDRSLFRCRFNASVNLNNVIFYEGVQFRGTRSVTILLSGVESRDNVFGTAVVLTNSAGSATHRISFAKRIFELWRSIMVKFKTVLRHTIDRGKKTINKTYKLLSRVYDQLRVKLPPLNEEQICRVFHGDAQMNDVEFRRPERTVFSMVDLSKTYLRGTNLRGVKFWDIIWWQPKLRRNGLYDELFIGRSKDRSFRKVYLPQLEETYRNVRVALEDNRDYSAAADFYIGEMEAARAQKSFLKRHIFSVVAAYRWLNGYGTKPLQAFLIFLFFLSIHLGLTLMLPNVSREEVLKVGGFQISANAFFDALKVEIACLLNSLQVMTLQRTDSFIKVGGLQNLLDTVFRVLGPAQLSLMVLALRARIKRH